MRIRARMHPEPGDVFGPSAFATTIGKIVPVPVGPTIYHGTVLGALVEPDGSFATLDLDVPGLTVDSQRIID